MDALRLKSLLHGSAPVILRSANLFADVPARLTEEQVKPLADRPGARVERIVSTGQASPAGFWYDQDWAEWVIVLAGAAGLLIEGEERPRTLSIETCRQRQPFSCDRNE
jgi:hypothetical protein